MSDYSFDKDTILSRPIKDENDLADVIVEMRKAMAYLLEANITLTEKVAVLEVQTQAYIAIEESKRVDATMRRSAMIPPSTWPGSLTSTTGPKTASQMREEMRERMDMLVNPPIVMDKCEDAMKEYKP